MKNQIAKNLLALRLDEHLGTHLGMKGLNILLFGWTAKDPNSVPISATVIGFMTTR